ncbi:MAG: YraN family protein [Pseudomonadota bacterium]
MQEKTRKNKELGDVGEHIACLYLEGLGFRILDQNVRYKMGEIDIVAQKGNDLHFIEVKTRSNSSFAMPLDSITKAKKTRMKRAAQIYICSRKDFKDNNLPPCFIDVISIDCSFGKPEIELIVDAIK